MSSLVAVVCTTMIVIVLAPFTGFTVSTPFMCMVLFSASYAFAHDVTKIIGEK